jgi:hypothetical protein
MDTPSKPNPNPNPNPNPITNVNSNSNIYKKSSSLWFSGIIIIVSLLFIGSIHYTIYTNTLQLTGNPSTNSNVNTQMIIYYFLIVGVLIAILLVQQAKGSGTIYHKILSVFYTFTLGGIFYTNYYVANQSIQTIISNGGSGASQYENQNWSTLIRIIIGTGFTAILSCIPLWITLGTTQEVFGNALLHLFEGDMFTGLFLTLLLPIGLLPLIWYHFGMSVNGQSFTIGIASFSTVYWFGIFIALYFILFS